jgi:hypothetical protein
MGKVEKLVAGGRVHGGECLVVGRCLPFVVACVGVSCEPQKEKEDLHEQTGRDRGFSSRGELDSLVYVGHGG